MNKVNDILLSPDSVISLHAQLNNQLRHLILSGRWQSGTRIPSENQLTDHLKISRSTVRLALQQAELAGLIVRVAGRGTYVAHPPSKTSGNRLISFVSCDFDAENQLLLLSGAENEAKAYGYQIIFSTAKGHQEQIEILQRLRGNVAGVLLWPNSNSSWLQQQDETNHARVRLPIVLMDRKINGFDCDCVTSDNYGGARRLMQHLVELGHQHVVFLTHHETALLPVIERYRAYCDTLSEHGLTPVEPWTIGQHGLEISVTNALRSSFDNKSPELQQIKDYMINAKPRPTAIFALNDYIAVLAMRAIRLLGLQIPNDISIAGFDDSDLGVHLEVPLTTVAQDFFTIGKQAARLLFDQLEGYSGSTRCEIIPTQLRIRSSTSVFERV